MNLYCQSCGFPMTQNEAIWYQGRCGCCVEDDLQRLEDYQQGKADPKLDYFFGVTPSDKEKH
jgi:hypothetical protein